MGKELAKEKYKNRRKLKGDMVTSEIGDLQIRPRQLPRKANGEMADRSTLETFVKYGFHLQYEAVLPGTNEVVCGAMDRNSTVFAVKQLRKPRENKG